MQIEVPSGVDEGVARTILLVLRDALQSGNVVDIHIFVGRMDKSGFPNPIEIESVVRHRRYLGA